MRLVQGGHINNSLQTGENMLNEVSDDVMRSCLSHIPYGESKVSDVL